MNDLVQLHTCEPIDAERLVRELRPRIDPQWLHRWARLSVAVTGPWRPADVWAGGLERLVWSATFSYPDGGFFTEAGERAAGERNGLARRQAPIHPAEILGPAFSAALVLWHSDAGRTTCASVWRERHLRWSLRLDDGQRLARCDGERVVIEAPPRHLPEVDRVGVLLGGWTRLLGEFPRIEGRDRLMFVDTLEALTAEAPAESLYAEGSWAGERVRAYARG
ncbi:MAG: hypothetical protein EXR71_05140 [Myxococcales bacterium]|nr:hypothetical protein [Myxococcales bacterium]